MQHIQHTQTVYLTDFNSLYRGRRAKPEKVHGPNRRIAEKYGSFRWIAPAGTKRRGEGPTGNTNNASSENDTPPWAGWVVVNGRLPPPAHANTGHDSTLRWVESREDGEPPKKKKKT